MEATEQSTVRGATGHGTGSLHRLHQTHTSRAGTRLSRLAVSSAAVLFLALGAAGLLGMTGLDGAAAPVPALAMGTADTRGRERCEACHVIEPTFSHPIDIAPSMSVPPELPLQDGRITCGTCHEAESPARHDAAALARTGTMLLRIAADRICAACHAPQGFTRVDMHAGAVGRAHLPGAHLSGTAGAADARDGLVDSRSDLCLACHDGTIAVGVGHQPLDPDVPHRWRTRPEAHPVGIEYPRETGTLRDAPLRAADRLDPRIRLFDRQVGCGSCHSPYSTEPGLLVMSNQGSALCLACHEF